MRDTIKGKIVSIFVKGNTKVKEFLNNERGDIVQTAVIIGILAILAIAVLTMLKAPITSVFNKIKDALSKM